MTHLGHLHIKALVAQMAVCLNHQQDSDIAWHYDRDNLYGHYLPTNYNLPPFRGGNTTDTFIDESQHFMVRRSAAAKSTQAERCFSILLYPRLEKVHQTQERQQECSCWTT